MKLCDGNQAIGGKVQKDKLDLQMDQALKIHRSGVREEARNGTQMTPITDASPYPACRVMTEP